MEKLKTILFILGIWAVSAALSYILRFILCYIYVIIAYIIGGIKILFFGTDKMFDDNMALNEYQIWHIYLIVTGIIAFIFVFKTLDSENIQSPKQIAQNRAAYLQKIEIEKAIKEAEEKQTREEKVLKVANIGTIPHLSETDKIQMLKDTAAEIERWEKQNNLLQIGKTKARWCLMHNYTLQDSYDVGNHITFNCEKKRMSKVELGEVVIAKCLAASRNRVL